MGFPSVRASAMADWQQALSKSDLRHNRNLDGLRTEINHLLSARPDRVPLPRFVDILERTGQATSNSLLAWSTGHRTGYWLNSDLGRAVLGCQTVGSALQRLCYFFPLVQDDSLLKLEVADSCATLSYKILDPNIWPRHEDAVYSLGTYSRIVRQAIPEAWSQVQLSVEVEQGAVRPGLCGITRAEVLYGCVCNSIRFPARVLKAPLNLVRPYDHKLIKRLSRKLTRVHRSTPVRTRTRRLILAEMNEGRVNQEHVAKSLGMSSRTLRRRLAAENTSFQKLLDECRMQSAALEFRTRRPFSLSDMALKLGYSGHSTFSRAFSRWAGMPPHEFRRSVAIY